MFKILDKTQTQTLTTVEDAYDTLVEAVLNEGNSFKFKLPQTSVSAQYVKEGNYIELDGQLYFIDRYSVVREVGRILNVECQHVFWELEKEFWSNTFEVATTVEWTANTKMIQGEFYTYPDDTDPNIIKTYQCTTEHTSTDTFNPDYFKDVTGLENNFQPATTPDKLLTLLFRNTPFKVGTCYAFTATDFTITKGNVLSNMKKIQETWGGEWLIDNYTIALIEKVGADNGIRFEYAKNNVSVTKEVDTKDTITRLYIYGKNGLTLESVNNNLQYLDADPIYFDLFNRPLIGEISFDEEDINNLKTKATEYLQTVQAPYISYTLSVAELKHLAGLETSEKFGLGDTVTVADTELLGQEITTRIVNYSYNPFKHNEVSNVTLNNKRKTLQTIFNVIAEKQEKDKEELVKKIEEIATTPNVINSIVEVTNQQVVNVETVHALNAWIRNLYIDRLETAFWDKDARNKIAKAERNFITIKEQDIRFISQDLDLTQTEDLYIPNPDPVVGGLIPVYYTAIGTHPDAYRFFTIVAPSVMYKEIIPDSPEELAFRVKVYKSLKQIEKMVIRFKEDTNTPYIVFGSGAVEGQDPWVFNGKTYITHWEDPDYWGLNITYTTKAGDLRRLRIDEDGISADIDNPDPSKRQLRNIYVSDFSPTATDGQNGDIWFVR